MRGFGKAIAEGGKRGTARKGGGSRRELVAGSGGVLRTGGVRR